MTQTSNLKVGDSVIVDGIDNDSDIKILWMGKHIARVSVDGIECNIDLSKLTKK